MAKISFVREPQPRALLSSVLAFLVSACGSEPPDPSTSQAPSTNEPASPMAAPSASTSPPSRPQTAGTTNSPTTSENRAVPYRGINLAGAEFGSAIPGREGLDYSFPTTTAIDYYLSKGMNTFRIGFKWERMQRAAYGPLDEDYTKKIGALVTYASSRGATVILEPHNFARYYGSTVGSPQVPNAVFANFWSRLAQLWIRDAHVAFNLVNEPHDMPTEQWVGSANSAIQAIRQTGSRNVILVPGNAWTGAHSWASNGYGTPNSVAMLKVTDPINNILFEAHQYMDADSSGTSDTCLGATVGSTRLAPFISWLRANKLKGLIGELAGGRNQQCYAAVTDMLTTIHTNADVLTGWLWWAGGPAWQDYVFTLEPTGGKDRPQMAVLSPFLKE